MNGKTTQVTRERGIIKYVLSFSTAAGNFIPNINLQNKLAAIRAIKKSLELKIKYFSTVSELFIESIPNKK